MTKLKYYVHPVLWATYPVVYLYSCNISDISYHAVLRPITVLIGVALLALFCCCLVIRNKQVSALIVSWSTILLFNYGAFYDLFDPPLRHRVLLLIWAILWLIGYFIIVKFERHRERINKYFILLVIILIMLAMTRVVTFYLAHNNFFKSTEDERLKSSGNTLPVVDPNAPDIYFIVFDSYTSSDVLKDIYGFDNHDIEDYLREKGFFVVPNGRSNYRITNYSIPATLNMAYLQDLDQELNEKNSPFNRKFERLDKSMAVSVGKLKMRYLKSNSKVVQMLKQRGYTYLNYSRWHGRPVNIKESFFNGISDFEENLMNMSIAKVFKNMWGAAGEVFTVLENIKKAPEAKGPVFVYAHMLIPHDFIFDDKGRKASRGFSKTSSVGQAKGRYITQIKFVNKKIKEIVGTILKKSRRPPIIIIQSDHGPWTLGFAKEEQNLYFRTRIFNACYFPDGGQKVLYDGMTSVNTFRVLMDYYFGTKMGLLPDKSYFDSGVYTLNWGEVKKVPLPQEDIRLPDFKGKN